MIPSMLNYPFKADYCFRFKLVAAHVLEKLFPIYLQRYRKYISVACL